MTSSSQKAELFSIDFTGETEAKFSHNEITLKNNAVKAVWVLHNNSIQLKELENNYNNTKANLEKVMLFEIELENGEQFNNFDFKLQGKINISSLNPTDSLPTKALTFAGKEVSGDFISNDDNILIRWSAVLRDGSNYIRQNIIIKVHHNPVKIAKISFFDGELKGAKYAGSVIGSPIVTKDFFFGFEHPIAKSKALFSRTLGNINEENFNISKLIDKGGDYVLAIEHGGGSEDFNVNAVSLLKDTIKISTHKHVLNGYNGSNLYHLNIENYEDTGNYRIKIDLANKEKATGIAHIYKTTNDILNFYINREDELKPTSSISEWAVMGVSPVNQNRRAFGYYIERERARPYKQFLHYNCWWDITDDGASSFTSQQLIERMHAWNKKFMEPFQIKLDAFVFDDGWDNLDSVWYFDPLKFPNGFADQADLCKKYNSGIGVWMSPFGGYLENKERRVASAKREGLETNDKGLSLAGKNYFNRFYERSLDMLTNYKVNYFKYDGFGGSEPKYLPDMEAGARLISLLRQENPDVYINITVGSWPSPFWLQYADCTWRGSGDLHNAGVGSTTQKFITYRDGTLHNNVVNRAPLYPLNSIMTVGVAYANLGHPSRFINDNIDDFKDMVRSSFAAGSSLQELYISHDRMKDSFWPILAEAVTWSKENEDILKDTHWIGGSPINLEIYGFASWKSGKGIVSLRNPSDQELVYDLNVNEIFELSDNELNTYFLKSPWKDNREDALVQIQSDRIYKVILKPFELIILETVTQVHL